MSKVRPAAWESRARMSILFRLTAVSCRYRRSRTYQPDINKKISINLHTPRYLLPELPTLPPSRAGDFHRAESQLLEVQADVSSEDSVERVRRGSQPADL